MSAPVDVQAVLFGALRERLFDLYPERSPASLDDEAHRLASYAAPKLEAAGAGDTRRAAAEALIAAADALAGAEGLSTAPAVADWLQARAVVIRSGGTP
jgi:hypothetical protein